MREPPSTPFQRSLLQKQRALVVPPLPRSLASLGAGPPRFEAQADDPRPGLFPEFASAVPLQLRAHGFSPSLQSAADSRDNGGSIESGSSRDSNFMGGGYGSGFLGQGSVPSSASTDAGAWGAAAGGGASAIIAPLRVGVVFAGERSSLELPAHPVNVVAGLFAYLAAVAPGSRLIGFEDGPSGLLSGRCRQLHLEGSLASLNQMLDRHLLGYSTCSDGGFAPKDRAEEAARAAAVCSAERLDGLVVIAGPRDLSWAAALAVNFLSIGCRTSVVGVPHSKNLSMYVPHYMSVTLGFDSARCRLGEVAGNIAIDSLSSKKYWHFIRCGRDALTVEVALQTRCTATVLTAEWREAGPRIASPAPPTTSPAATASPAPPASEGAPLERMSLKATAERLRDVVERRRATGHLSGVVLLSRELVETLPEMDQLKQDLKDILDSDDLAPVSRRGSILNEVEHLLQRESSLALFKRLPRVAQSSLLQRRDASSMPLLPSDLESERILGRYVQEELKAKGAVKEESFAPRFHTMELMSNAPLPTPFDCAFGYTLGHTAAALLCERRSFYVASCAEMHLPVADWVPCAIPFSSLYPAMDGALNDGSQYVIPKVSWAARRNLALAYQHFCEVWVERNQFNAPGPIQFGDGGDVGPMSCRSFALLAEYVSLDELKQLIQPVAVLPPPLTILSRPNFLREVRVAGNLSHLEQRRLLYEPALPPYLRGPVRAQDDLMTPQACNSSAELAQYFPLTYGQGAAIRLVAASDEKDTSAVSIARSSGPEGLGSPADAARPLRVGVVFTSPQAPGFHNVVAGIFDCLVRLSPPPEVIGFLGGYEGLIKGLTVRIDSAMVDQYRNLGGQDMLCQFGDYTSLGFKDHLGAVVSTITAHQLDGLVLVGDPESQVDSAFVAEVCSSKHLATRVVGVPVTMHCDFPFVQQTVGYDTVCRTLSSFLGDIVSLTRTSEDLWIFVRMAGDAASHVAIQCALQAHPNLVLLAGTHSGGQYLGPLINRLCDLIFARHEAGYDFGVVMLPHGFVTEIVEMRLLFAEISELTSSVDLDASWSIVSKISAKLKPSSAALFDAIPRDVQYEICFGGRERGTTSIDLSSIETERLILRFVEIELQRRQRLGFFQEPFFQGSCYPMVYHARSALPTDFDCDLAYSLGWAAALLVRLGKSGLVVHAANLERSPSEWQLRGIPLTCLLRAEPNLSTGKHRILPACLRLLKQRGIERPFKALLPPPEERSGVHQGPVQYWGDVATHPSVRTTWFMENMPLQDPTEVLQQIAGLCGELQSTMAKAKAESTMYAVNSILANALSIIDSFKQLDVSRRERTSSLEVPTAQMAQVWRTKTDFERLISSSSLASTSGMFAQASRRVE